MHIREIERQDNLAIANIIRQTLEEFGANHRGTVYYDEAIWRMSELFDIDRSCYFVVEDAGKIVGGAGIYPTQGLPSDTVELVKLYLLPETRGKGIGRKLIDKCLEFAKVNGYSTVYLESMPELSNAVELYEKIGFSFIDAPMGNSGHSYCTIWMTKNV